MNDQLYDLIEKAKICFPDQWGEQIFHVVTPRCCSVILDLLFIIDSPIEEPLADRFSFWSDRDTGTSHRYGQ